MFLNAKRSQIKQNILLIQLSNSPLKSITDKEKVVFFPKWGLEEVKIHNNCKRQNLKLKDNKEVNPPIFHYIHQSLPAETLT